MAEIQVIAKVKGVFAVCLMKGELQWIPMDAPDIGKIEDGDLPESIERISFLSDRGALYYKVATIGHGGMVGPTRKELHARFVREMLSHLDCG